MDANILSYIDKELDHVVLTKRMVEECLDTMEQYISMIRATDVRHVREWKRYAIHIQEQAERIQDLTTQFIAIRSTLTELTDSLPLSGDYKDYIMAKEEKLLKF